MNYVWQKAAACKGQPQSVFFPEPGPGTGAVAHVVCGVCPVRTECLNYAIKTRQEYGIWGGMNPRERQAFEDNGHRRRLHTTGIMRGTARANGTVPLAERQTVTADGR